MTAEQNIAQLALTTMTRLSWAQVPNLTPQPRATVLQVVASANKQQVCFVLIFRVSVFALSMDDVSEWLDANRLAVGQPAPPTSALWWRLGDKAFNAAVGEWSARTDLNILIGVSGAGKTRSLYEMLARNFGFFWTCSRAGNGGASIVVRQLGPSAGTEPRRSAPK
jgi:hypothetical protein